MQSDWELYKQTNMQYDPAINYFNLVVENEIQFDKYSKQPQGETFVRQWLHGSLRDCYEELKKSDEYVKQKFYKWYVANEYDKFRRNWKPNDTKDEGLNFLWVTFNFKSDTDLNVIKVDMSRILSLAIFDNTKITYCYEYHTEQGTHPHVHALIELNRTGTIPMSKIEQDIFKDKKLRDRLSLCIRFSWAKKFDLRCQKRAICQAYLNGNKIDEKKENVENDKTWRKENNLEELYIKENK